MSEQHFQGAVVELAHVMGWLTFHAYDSRRSTPGYPDLTLVRDDRLVFAELKTDTGRLSPAQRDWLEALTAAGAEVHVWRPNQWTEITDTLKRGHLSAATAGGARG